MTKTTTAKKSTTCRGCNTRRRLAHVQAKKPCTRCSWLPGADNVQHHGNGGPYYTPAAG